MHWSDASCTWLRRVLLMPLCSGSLARAARMLKAPGENTQPIRFPWVVNHLQAITANA